MHFAGKSFTSDNSGSKKSFSSNEFIYGRLEFRENYEGGGNYGPLEVAYTSASEKQDRGIDCDRIKQMFQ